MKRLIILLSVLLLTGCPIEFYALVENRSESDVEFISQNAAKTRELVKPGETKKVNVSSGCQLVAVGESTGYLNFSTVPRDAWASLEGGSKIQFEISYSSARFSLKASDGKIYDLEIQGSCQD